MLQQRKGERPTVGCSDGTLYKVQVCFAVPLYDSLGESAVEYTVNHSETSIIFAEASKMEFIAKAAGAIKKSVKHVVFWGSHACTDGASATVKKEASPKYPPLHSAVAFGSPVD